jgi:hypothetical protein
MSTTGLRTGAFDDLRVVDSAGALTNILDLVGSGGGIQTATAPLSITGTDIALDTSGLASSSSIANKIDTLTSISPIAVSGTGTERYISTLFKPSTVTVSQGLFALGSDSLGTLSLALTGQESRTQVRLMDPSTSIIRVLSTSGGDLVWDGVAIPSLNGLEVVSPLSLATNDTTNAWLGIAGSTGFQNYWVLHSSGAYAEVTYGSLDYVRTSAITVPAGETLTFSVQAMLTTGQATNTSSFFALGTTT